MLRFTRSALGRVLAIAAIAAWPIALVSHASAQTPTPTPRPFPVGNTVAAAAGQATQHPGAHADGRTGRRRGAARRCHPPARSARPSTPARRRSK